MLNNFLLRLRERFAPAIAAPKPQPPVLAVNPEPAPRPRDVSAAPSAVEILENEPDLTAAELAKRAGVTLSYARSLIRRRNAKRPTVLRPVASDNSLTLLQSQVRDLARRLEETESRFVRPPSVSHVTSSRTHVLDRSAAGVPVNAISEELGIPVGEAEFILKVDRLKNSLKQ